MRCDFALQFLLLVAIVGQIHAQEDSNGLGNSTNNNDTPTNNHNGTGTDNDGVYNSIPPTLSPSISDTMGSTPTPSEASLSATPDLLNATLQPIMITEEPSPTMAPAKNTSTLTPTEMPSAEPYLLMRPLHNIQLSLIGPLSAIQQEQLLVVLKVMFEQSLYSAMVEYFIPESVKKEKLENVFNRTNMTKEELRELSILSKVFLEWTVTNSTIAVVTSSNNSTVNSTDASIGEEVPKNMHILQARGSLGFTKYDYALLQPQAIIPLQERIFAGRSNDSPISLSVELALQMKGFSSLEVLQLILTEAEEVPTLSPTVWPPWHDHDNDDDENTNDQNDENDEDEPNTADDNSDESTILNDDDDDLGTKVEPKSRFASKEEIRLALIVAGTASAIAFFLFLVFVRRKSQRIKKDRLSRKQRVSKKDGVANEEDDKEDSPKKVTSPTTMAIFSGTTIRDLSSKSTSSSSVESSLARIEYPNYCTPITTSTIHSSGSMTSPNNAPAETTDDVETSDDIEVGDSKSGENDSITENATIVRRTSSTTDESSNEVGGRRSVSSIGNTTTTARTSTNKVQIAATSTDIEESGEIAATTVVTTIITVIWGAAASTTESPVMVDDDSVVGDTAGQASTYR